MIIIKLVCDLCGKVGPSEPADPMEPKTSINRLRYDHGWTRPAGTDRDFCPDCSRRMGGGE